MGWGPALNKKGEGELSTSVQLLCFLHVNALWLASHLKLLLP